MYTNNIELNEKNKMLLIYKIMKSDTMNLPEYMKMNSVEMMKSVIKKRADFNNLVEKIGLESFVSQRLQAANENYLIVGSRAWNRWFKETSTPSISITDNKNSAFTAGNFDVFIFTTELKETLTKMYNIFSDIKEQLQLDAQENVYLKLELNGFKVNKMNNITSIQEVETILFPGYELLLYLYPYNERTKRRKTLEHFSEEDKQLALYCKIFSSKKHIDLASIAHVDPSNNLRFANEVGLFVFMTLLRTQRTDKGINVDKIRYDTLIDSLNLPLSQIYEYTLTAYNHIFGGSKFYDENIIDRINFEILKNRDPITRSYLTEIDFWLMSKFRTHVNTFIYCVHQKLKEQRLDAQIFLVGGDAMKRHKRTMSKTADFDMKIYCTKSHKEKVEVIVKQVCVKLIDHMSSNLEHLVSDQIHFNDITLTLRTLKNIQFRLRKIKEHDNFLFDLYSVDYRYYISHNKRFKVDIAFLDVVIQTVQSKKDLDTSQVVLINDIPVASLDFLINDIKKTYTTKELAVQRYWSGKRNKDLQRYKILHNIKMNKLLNISYKQDLNVHDDNILNFLKQEDTVQQSHYINTFNELTKKNKHSVKYKMPFTKK